MICRFSTIASQKAKTKDDTTLPWAKLYLSCASHTDMDMYIQLRKIGINSSPLAHSNYPISFPIYKPNNSNVATYKGPTDILHASHAVSQVPKQNEYEYPVYTHRERRGVEKGAVVELEISIRQLSVVYCEGEGLEVTVSGRDKRLPGWKG